MQTTKQAFRKFLNDNFKGLRIRTPLFYRWEFGLRFDLQFGNTDTDEYFNEVTRRASGIFESVFDNSDNVFLLFMDYKYKRRKIRFGNFVFRQINKLDKREISYSKENGLYEPGVNYNVAVIELTSNRINHKSILTAIGHSDFPPREPRLDNYSVLTSKEVYFVNADKKLIFHMYDDRGLDIIATDKATLKPIYAKHHDWILEYDRERIDKQFQ